ncbi:GIY-YIG nuclease family protein [Funiculus sociatus GB2-A5]|uniref:GIY-YIG nuclease family protein n=2 Tax=Cyanophyceae TaxID=3028117 RepID=A0ABV0JKN1_9CYAN|nr:GIY-YIG nuclease family protein [Trichocoleus sp. FACHB-832]MBD1906195.1 GIY-YIG nuclease family protein [Trichocoleus sp. FACHB-832]MBD2061360.1 GIY-YIG nuclease family protein [Trichocoleus sp. FACHB-6]
MNLPSVPLEMKFQLPRTSSIYFAIDSSNKVQYIGKANNLRQRWSSHNKFWEIKILNRVRLAWLEISEKSQLSLAEKELIKYFNPPLNRIKIDPRRTAKVIELRRKGKSHRLIAEELGIDEKQVRRILKGINDSFPNKVLGTNGKLYSCKYKPNIQKQGVGGGITNIEELEQHLALKDEEIQRISHELLLLSEENTSLKAELENILRPPS